MEKTLYNVKVGDNEAYQFQCHRERMTVDYDNDPEFPSYSLYVDGKLIERVMLWGKLGWGRIKSGLEAKGRKLIGKFKSKGE